ncbi:MAG TPA: hypothetical protein VH040_07245 [Usitatibacter sp.]|nr:hypothetical protein [Usitatibacter sp.]
MTDDPEPVDSRRWEINSAITGAWGAGQANVGVPTIDINYGALPDVQLHAQPRYSYVKDDAGGRHGLDDTELGVKFRLVNLKEGETQTMVGVYPMYEAATGAKRLGEDRGRQQIFLPVWIQENVGRWTVYGGAGYRFNRFPQGKNSIFTGITALYAVSDRLQLGGEAFGESAVTSDGVRSRGANVGGTIKLTESLSLLISAGRLQSAGSQAMAYLGLQAHF